MENNNNQDKSDRKAQQRPINDDAHRGGLDQQSPEQAGDEVKRGGQEQNRHQQGQLPGGGGRHGTIRESNPGKIRLGPVEADDKVGVEDINQDDNTSIDNDADNNSDQSRI